MVLWCRKYTDRYFRLAVARQSCALEGSLLLLLVQLFIPQLNTERLGGLENALVMLSCFLCETTDSSPPLHVFACELGVMGYDLWLAPMALLRSSA